MSSPNVYPLFATADEEIHAPVGESTVLKITRGVRTPEAVVVLFNRRPTDRELTELRKRLIEREERDPKIERDARELIQFINKVTGCSFRQVEANLRFARARLRTTDLATCKRVVAFMSDEWRGTDQEKYLRPETLLNETKFEGYLGRVAK